MKVWINADDYGWDETCSRAILESFKLGWLTTTTACVNGSFFDEAIEMIKQTKYENMVGIHFNLTEGRPVSEEIRSVGRIVKNGEFYGFPSRQIPLKHSDKTAVYMELQAQLDKYMAMQLDVNHIDSHHFIHNSISIFPIVKRLAIENRISNVRQFRNVGHISLLRKLVKGHYNRILKRNILLYSDYFGSVEDYMGFLGGKEDDIFEIMVHPDYALNGQLIDRNNADYTNPTGSALSNLIELIQKRKDIIIC